jgi:endonuclease/exonuclease/phosphatase family metal-dependent hydrolase
VGSTLRVLSGNLFRGRADPAAFAELVTAVNADVVAVQEAGPEQAEALSEIMPHGYIEAADDHTGLGIVMKGPGELGRIAMGWRDAHRVLLHPGDWSSLSRPVELVNVHMAAPHACKPPLWGFPLRYRQVRALERYLIDRGQMAPEISTVVVGDFNATPAWPLYRRISPHLTDAASAVAETRGRPPQRTWGPWPGSPRLIRIDHAFVRGISAHDFRVVAIQDSDHSAIVVDLSVD